MKNLLILCLFTILGNWVTAYSQDNISREKPVLTVEQQQAVDAIVTMDPKLTAEEIENLQLAVLGAPVDAQPIADPKMDNPPDKTVHAPWKAEPIEQRDDAFEQPVSQPSPIQTLTTGTQPEPAKAENVINYQTINGPADQPQPAKAENTINYNTINGPQTQPEPKPKGN